MMQKLKEKAVITAPEHVFEIISAILKAEQPIDQEKEHFWAIGLNTRNVVKFVDLVSLGSLDSSICHPRETFRLAVSKGVSSIIIAHNHPSGDPDPSVDDVEMTRRMVEAGKILGITVLDHIIVGNGTNEYQTMKGRGLVNFDMVR